VCGEYCTFDPEAAKEALEKAGGWPEGETLTIHLGQDQTEQEYFQAIGDQITLNLGIPYELDPSPDFFSRRTDRDFDGPWRANWFPDYPLNENYLAPIYASGGEDKSELGYYNEDFEKKMAEGDAAATPDEAVAKYAEAEKIIAEDFPTIPISVSNTVQYHSDRVSNVVLDPFSGQPKLRLLKVE
jgi:ABC-type transport system substrate-binding protein